MKKRYKLWISGILILCLLAGSAFGAQIQEVFDQEPGVELTERVMRTEAAQRGGDGGLQQGSDRLQTSAGVSPPSHRRSRFSWMTSKRTLAVCLAGAIIGGITFACLKSSSRQNAESDSKADSLANTLLPPFQRGMYVSIWTDNISRPDLAPRYAQILGNPDKEKTLLDFITRYRIDSLSFYDLPVLLDLPGMAKHLSAFIIAARARGVVQFHAVGSKKRDWDWISEYQKTFPGKFDGLLTENEFWNAPAGEISRQFNEFIQLLKYMKTLKVKNLGRDLKISVYLGRIDSVPDLSEENVASLVMANSDQVYQNCYGTTPHGTYQNCKSRLGKLFGSKKDVALTPLVSVEGADFSAYENETFLGTWLKNGTLGQLEANITGQFSKDNAGAQLTGFYYFEYRYMHYYLGG